MNYNFIKLIPLKIRKKIIAELTKQHKAERHDYELCFRVRGQYFDIMNGCKAWHIRICDISDSGMYESRAAALKGMKEILLNA